MQTVPLTAPYEFRRSKKLAQAHIRSTTELMSAPEVLANRQKRLNDRITDILADELTAALSSLNFNEAQS
ncbi:hypothetical protein [Pseudochrobactrum asaccharolyticum]|uniref:Uncharacterized protein n=1 Tax=Pseudochrobactrum asaccharolyticum TaxID=354351 RepID=A0A366DRI4_9HYPH|nr:hypothetical protein [Pseudochrobactrum asaccharolyticum]RBO91884.1 hypothetical protein DFR47_10825 [Pseudochrobactrum asaccharolyticum]